MNLTFPFRPMPVISDGRDALGKHRRELSCVIRKLLCLAAAFAALASGAAAQDWPNRPVTMVVPFAAGGPMDTLARILQPALGETLGQQIIIENMPGGGGLTGSLRVAQAAVDSHMFVLASIGTHAIGYSMHSKPLYHPANDFQPVAFVADAPLMLMTKKDLPPNSLKEFMAYTKANHDKMSFSSGGTGTSSHVSCVMLNQIMGVDVTHVPYRGGGPAFQDVIAGRIDYICNYISIGAVGGEGRPGQGAGDAGARPHGRFSPISRPPTSRA